MKDLLGLFGFAAWLGGLFAYGWIVFTLGERL